MRRSIAILACAGLWIVASPNLSQAEPPTPGPLFDAPDQMYKGGGDHVPYIDLDAQRKKREEGREVPYTPVITAARIVKGHVHFTFRSGGVTTLKYNILWSRSGKPLTGDIRWYTGRAEEEYIINEPVRPDTYYWFRVQAMGKNKTKRGADGVYQYPVTEFVGRIFHTPPGPSIADKAKLGAKYSDLLDPSTKKPSPFGGTKVETPIKLAPRPIVGRYAVTESPFLLPTVLPTPTVPRK